MEEVGFDNVVMFPKDGDGMANSVDPDQTAPRAVWSGSALFAQTYSLITENFSLFRGK